MNIAICFDKNYQKWATVCLYSIWKQHKYEPKIRLIILSDIDYSLAIWQLKKVLKNFDFTFDNPGNDFDDMPTGFHFNVTTYWRLALPNVLAKYGIERAIYLDTDTLIVDNLQELFNINLNGKTCGGCLDIGSDMHIERMGLKQGFAINGGVLLMDVAKINQFNWAEVANQLNKEGRIKWVDQDVINIVLDGEIVLLDLKWNTQTSHFKSKSYIPKAVIYHFTSNGVGHKPWQNKYRRLKIVRRYFELVRKSGFVFDYLKYQIELVWALSFFKNKL